MFRPRAGVPESANGGIRKSEVGRQLIRVLFLSVATLCQLEAMFAY